MAGDGWVVDIIWHAMILGANALPNVWSNWSIEILLVASFGMQLALTIFSGFRWRGASPRLRPVIWLFYVGSDYIATTALGILSVSSASGERQLVAFWAPFFLLHLGGPDSITAYQLEDNELSARSMLELVLRVLGALYVVYKSISGSWTLTLAAWLMLAVGVAKYVEKTLALHRANLGNVRSSVKNPRRRRHHSNPAFPGDDSDLVMKAHSLFYICKRAIVDSSVEMESDEDAADIKETLFRFKWDELCWVMEMELSLMYDFLYTKASVIHTWHGYCIRAFSPLFTAVALPLVEFSNEDGRHKHSDVVITRILLVATLLLETASLLTALASSWTAFLLDSRLPPGWLRHQVLCTTRWQRFRCVVASFARFAKVHEHRKWSGKIGQLNLLQHITREEQPSSCAAKEQEYWDNKERYKEMIIPPDVKELVFKRVWAKLLELRRTMKKEVTETEGEGASPELDLLKISIQFRTKRGQQTLRKHKLYKDLRWSLGDELQEGILTWHIATDIYLFNSGKVKAVEGTEAARQVRAVRRLSNYMMYLLVVRPDMLPGLVIRRLHELTNEDLVRIWSKYRNQDFSDLEPSSSYSSLCNVRAMLRKLFQLHDDWRISCRLNQRQEKLARILHDDWHSWDSDATNPYLSSGIELAKRLLSLDESRKWDMVEVILEVWVEMLFYASYRCSKESHAKQLSNGGELTTVVWLMIEHVGLFIINKTGKASGEANWKSRKGAKRMTLD